MRESLFDRLRIGLSCLRSTWALISSRSRSSEVRVNASTASASGLRWPRKPPGKITRTTPGSRCGVTEVISGWQPQWTRTASMHIAAVRVHWGCHPEMTSVTPQRDPGVVRVIFPGGFLGHRKPLAEAVEAFTRTSDERLRLLIKAQVDRKQLKPILKRSKRDSRIELLLADQPTAEHLQTFANCDVCLAPARWEGLGLPLYEATAFGMPIVTNDDPPMNEIVVDGLNGLLVASRPDGPARSGITAWTPDVDHMARAIDRVADDEFRAGLSEGALEVRERLSWSRTMDDLGRLIERGVGVPAGAAGSKTQP